MLLPFIIILFFSFVFENMKNNSTIQCVCKNLLISQSRISVVSWVAEKWWEWWISLRCHLCTKATTMLYTHFSLLVVSTLKRKERKKLFKEEGIGGWRVEEVSMNNVISHYLAPLEHIDWVYVTHSYSFSEGLFSPFYSSFPFPFRMEMYIILFFYGH